jgi:CubicO group peptidase (beta-lactamase class C family)
MLYSLSKSFTSTAIGLGISEGLLSIDDKIVDLLPDDLPATVSPRLAAMTVRHLLTMSTGHGVDPMGSLGSSETNWSRLILSQELAYEPGSTFVYNSGATYLLSAIMHRLTGGRLLDYLTPRLLEPLGIVGGTWEQCPRGIDVGGWGFAITAEDIAVFAQTYLQGGVWNGVQLIPADWVAAATSRQIDTSQFDDPIDWKQGYGFQFWRNRNNSFRADGAFGQLAIVLPDHDTVVVTNAGLPGAWPILESVWKYLLPALGTDGALPPNSEQDARLSAALASLELQLPPIHGGSNGIARLDGVRFEFPTNDTRVRALALSSGSLTLWDDRGPHPINYAPGEWVVGDTIFGDKVSRPIATRGGWTSANRFVALVEYIETPYATTYVLAFDGDGVTLTVSPNVSFNSVAPIVVDGIASPSAA